MSGFLAALLIIGAVVVVLVIWGIVVYNRLISSRNASTEASRGTDVALETRFDQIKAQADAASGIVQQEVELILGATALRTGRTIGQLEMQEKTELNTALQDAEQHVLQQANSGPGRCTQTRAIPT